MVYGRTTTTMHEMGAPPRSTTRIPSHTRARGVIVIARALFVPPTQLDPPYRRRGAISLRTTEETRRRGAVDPGHPPLPDRCRYWFVFLLLAREEFGNRDSMVSMSGNNKMYIS